jgi:Family of unknown function (DUF6494)
LQWTKPKEEQPIMEDDRLNMSVRKHLKEFGVTAQRAIEAAVRERMHAGKLKGDEALKVKTTLEMADLGLVHVIEGEIELA